MLLAVNVGNKNISFAIFDGVEAEPVSKFKVAADLCRTADEYVVSVKQLLDYSGIDVKAVDGVIMASVPTFLLVPLSTTSSFTPVRVLSLFAPQVLWHSSSPRRTELHRFVSPRVRFVWFVWTARLPLVRSATLSTTLLRLVRPVRPDIRAFVLPFAVL